jgi:hypothetical protein
LRGLASGRNDHRHGPDKELSADCIGQQPVSIYAHPGNVLWPIMGELFGAGRSLPIGKESFAFSKPMSLCGTRFRLA